MLGLTYWNEQRFPLFQSILESSRAANGEFNFQLPGGKLQSAFRRTSAPLSWCALAHLNNNQTQGSRPPTMLWSGANAEPPPVEL